MWSFGRAWEEFPPGRQICCFRDGISGTGGNRPEDRTGARLRDLTIRVRNGQGHERFQTEDADLSVSEMTALNGALTEEMGALSYFTDLYVAKAGKNLLSVSTSEKDGKIRSVFFAAVDRRLYLLEEDKEYQEGDLRRLLEMEGEDHGEHTGIVSDDGRRTGGLAALLEASRPYTVLLPEEYRKKAYEGPLMGYYIENTKTFHVVLEQLMRIRKDCKVIGQAWKSGAQPERDTGSGNEAFVAVTWEDGTAHAEVPHSEAPVQVEYYQLKKEVFSRNQGILEYDQMSSRQAVIAGAGSGGAFVALEFAKAGIGSLVLADDDRLAYHNICRHPCGIHDVGKYKVDAVAERIADINPACQVYIFRDKIQHVDPQEFENVLWKNSILLCCSDNRHAGYVCNELADRYHIPMVDAGCGPRASTGEIFTISRTVVCHATPARMGRTMEWITPIRR